MKKNYINPQICIVKLNTANVISTSGDNMGYAGKSTGGRAEGRSRSGSIWDDEE